jgi:hypothetical protein
MSGAFRKMSNDYLLKFNLSSYEALDEFALLAAQKYNLGDKYDWFGNFRGGLYGFYARITGVQIHFKAVHSWDFSIKTSKIVDYNLSSVFFNMDSTIECLVFALNALGYIADSTKFIDITDEKKLRTIKPSNLIGSPPTYSNGFISGYEIYFPFLKKYWRESLELLETVFEQHDVSKHRSTTYQGGKFRNDPPSGFFEKLRIKDDEAKQISFYPMAEIYVVPQLKVPRLKRKPVKLEDIPILEDIAEKFCTFINVSGTKALEDAKNSIKLTYDEFKR